MKFEHILKVTSPGSPVFALKQATTSLEMKNILYLTDYSRYSQQVFRYALELAHHFKASVTLAHVYAPLMPASPVNFEEMMDYGPSPSPETQAVAQWDRERERLEYFAANHTPNAYKDVPFFFELPAGHPVPEIVRLQQEKHFGLTVMGLNSAGNLSHLVLGRVASGMIDRSASPLLLVPPTADYHGIKRILFATDLREDDLPIINGLLEWAKAFQASLTCLWAVDPEGLSPHSEKKETAEASIKKLRATEAFQSGELDFSMIESNKENFEKNILRAVDTQHADLVVMQTHRRNWWRHILEESTTKDIASEVFIPILIYNE